MTYDYLGRLSTTTYTQWADPSLDFQMESIAYEYDANGNLIKRTEMKRLAGTGFAEEYRFEYDKLDRLRRTRNHDGKTVDFVYDRQGNRTSVTDADGRATTYLYDERNRVRTVTAESGVTRYTYWEDGLIKAIQYPNQAVEDHSYANAYDKADRTMLVVNHFGAVGTAPTGDDPAFISSFAYTYDANGNRLTELEAHHDINAGAAEPTSYEYDNLDRLTKVAYGAGGINGQVTYTYALNGNRLTERGRDPVDPSQIIDRQYVYDRLNRVRAVINTADTTRSVAYDYDDNGNRISKVVGQIMTTPDANGNPVTIILAPLETTLYGYGIRDELLRAPDVSGGVVTFDYDATRMRVKKITPSGETRYLYDGDSTLIEYDLSLRTTIKYDYGSSLVSLVAVDPISQARSAQFYHHDALGSTSDLTNTAGRIQASYLYDAWGDTRRRDGNGSLLTFGSSVNAKQYTGHYHDTETDLHYLGARYYDDDTGVFLSQDPYQGEVSNPPSLHRFLYANANPLRYVDLHGYAAWTPKAPAGGWLKAPWTFDPVQQALGRLNAEIGTVARYQMFADKLDAIRDLSRLKVTKLGLIGLRLSENEHIIPRSWLETITRNPRTGISDFRSANYQNVLTVRVERTLALLKTPFDNAMNKLLKAGQGPVSFSDLIKEAIDNTKAARDQLIANKTELIPGYEGSRVSLRAIEHAALDQAGEMFNLFRAGVESVPATGVTETVHMRIGSPSAAEWGKYLASADDMFADEIAEVNAAAQAKAAAKATVAAEATAVAKATVAAEATVAQASTAAKGLASAETNMAAKASLAVEEAAKPGSGLRAMGGVKGLLGKGLGLGAAAYDAWQSGQQIGNGLNELAAAKNGQEKALAGVNIGEGSVKLGLGVASAKAVMSVGFVGSLAAGAVIAGSVALVAETVRAVIEGRKTPAERAEIFLGQQIFGDESALRGFASNITDFSYRGLGSRIWSALGSNLTGMTSSAGADGQFVSVVDYAQLAPAVMRSVELYLRSLPATGPLQLSFEIAPLAGGTLGTTSAARVGRDGLVRSALIRIDEDAAGVGWYVDDSLGGAEFDQPLDASASRAGAGSVAFGKYDLSTVLLHELGHALGFASPGEPSGRRSASVEGSAALAADGAHVDASAYPDDLMTEMLTPGVRRLPTALDLQILGALWATPRAADASADHSGSPGISSAPVGDAISGRGFAAAGVDAPFLGGMLSDAGITNGAFDVAEPAASGFGWEVRGGAEVVDGRGVLAEDPTRASRFAQELVLPTGARALVFTLVSAVFDPVGNGPQDAFEVALIDLGVEGVGGRWDWAWEYGCVVQPAGRWDASIGPATCS